MLKKQTNWYVHTYGMLSNKKELTINTKKNEINTRLGWHFSIIYESVLEFFWLVIICLTYGNDAEKKQTNPSGGALFFPLYLSCLILLLRFEASDLNMFLAVLYHSDPLFKGTYQLT